MRRLLKKGICMVTVLALVGLVVPLSSVKIKAAETVADTERVLAKVVVPEEEVFSAVTRAAANGLVDGSGVRLRKKPSSSATILELMNSGEYVNIDRIKSTANWYYLQRLKTGTFGYASKQYIYAF